ncbi:MAG: hypothetical protein LBQ67_03100, partial [Treponema sp.]|nr:hypothetical protein [Treponema sp.]
TTLFRSWTWFITGTDLRRYTSLINSLCPALLGIFTLWFVGWHPPHYARGAIKIVSQAGE